MKLVTVLHSGNAAIVFDWRIWRVGVTSLRHKAEEMLRDMARENKDNSRKLMRVIDCNLAN
jgi:hypothetical protein